MGKHQIFHRLNNKRKIFAELFFLKEILFAIWEDFSANMCRKISLIWLPVLCPALLWTRASVLVFQSLNRKKTIVFETFQKLSPDSCYREICTGNCPFIFPIWSNSSRSFRVKLVFSKFRGSQAFKFPFKVVIIFVAFSLLTKIYCFFSEFYWRLNCGCFLEFASREEHHCFTCLITFPSIFILWKESLSLDACVFLTCTCHLLNSGKIRKLLDSKFENFHHQIVANLPQNANEIVSFLKYVRVLGFLKKLVFQRKTWFFLSKSVHSHLCWRILTKWYYFFKIFFFLFKLRGSPKIFKFGKIRKFADEGMLPKTLSSFCKVS